jgi:alcohol dehydrogenase
MPASKAFAGRHDGVVAFGGGSALDVGKVHRLHGRPDAADVGFRGHRRLVDPRRSRRHPPIIAVPTTAGTGSEVGRAGVITNEATHTKKIIFHPLMMPKVVICDPELTVGMPKLHHRGHRHGCARALPGGLLRAVLSSDGRWHRGRGHAARQENSAARLSTTARSRSARDHDGAGRDGRDAFQKGLGAIHALSHPIGALYDTHHGMTNAVFMP